MHSDFKKDVRQARLHEARVANVAWKKAVGNPELKFDVNGSYQELKDKDFILGYEIGGKKVKVQFEQKSDFASTDTGNIAIEYFCNGKWSGIVTTKAHIWISSHYSDKDKKWHNFFASVRVLRSKLFVAGYPMQWFFNVKTMGKYWGSKTGNSQARLSGELSDSKSFLLNIDKHVIARPDCWLKMEDYELIDWISFV